MTQYPLDFNPQALVIAPSRYPSMTKKNDQSRSDQPQQGISAPDLRGEVRGDS
jgi:hypothetical protein